MPACGGYERRAEQARQSNKHADAKGRAALKTLDAAVQADMRAGEDLVVFARAGKTDPVWRGAPASVREALRVTGRTRGRPCSPYRQMLRDKGIDKGRALRRIQSFAVLSVAGVVARLKQAGHDDPRPFAYYAGRLVSLDADKALVGGGRVMAWLDAYLTYVISAGGGPGGAWPGTTNPPAQRAIAQRRPRFSTPLD